MRHSRLTLSTVLAVLLAATTAHASPLEMFGFGGRSPAIAATGVADGAGFDCVYLNPAGLAGIPRKRLSMGTMVGAFSLDGVDRNVDAAVGIELGGALPIPLGGVMKGRVGLGMGFYIPATVLLTARAPMPGKPFYSLLENRSRVIGLQVGVGVKLTERWSAGVSMLALASLTGHIDVGADSAGRFTSTSEQQLISQFAPIGGVRWKQSDRLVLGATLRFPSASSYDILVTNDLADALPVTLPELRFAGVAQYDPLMLVVEGAWRRDEHWLVLGQLAYERWSAFPLPTDNPVADMPPQEPPGFHDTVVPRLGVEWTATSGKHVWAGRAGYFFAWSPAPEMTGMQALLDNHRHVLSLGLGLAAPTSKFPFHLDAWFQFHYLQPRHHDRPDGQDDIDTSGQIFVGGVMFGVDL